MGPYFVPPDNIPDPHYPAKSYTNMRWIIEAPVNSVEVLEDILKPPHPYEIYKVRPIRQYRRGPLAQKMQMWQDSEGKLFQDREIQFVILSVEEWKHLLHWFDIRDFSTEPLTHMFIPWFDQLGKRLSPVWGALFASHREDIKARGLTCESARQAILKELGLMGHCFSRSLLPSDAAPLPEDRTALYEGRPGVSRKEYHIQ